MTEDRLKILIVTFYFPPLNRIGSLRPYSWAKYWSRMGHEVKVLTAKKEDYEGPLNLETNPNDIRSVGIEELPYWSLRKYTTNMREKLKTIDLDPSTPPPKKVFMRAQRWMIQAFRKTTGLDFYSPHLWTVPAIRRAVQIYRQWPFDVMVSTVKPPAPHLIAGILKRKLGVFWVADYRDLWYGDPDEMGKWPFSLLEKSIENFFVKEADLITTISGPLVDTFISRFGPKVIPIENGFDLDDKLEKVDFFPKDGKVRLVYTGTIEIGRRDPIPLFKAVDVLKNRGVPIEERLKLIFYGVPYRDLHKMVEEFNVRRVVQTYDYIERKTALQAQQNADALIFLDWNDPLTAGYLSGKIFEYMYSGTPVLCIGGEDHSVVKKLIDEAGIGTVAGRSVNKIADIIEALLRGEKIRYAPVEAVILKYTREQLAQKMLEAMIKLLETRKS